MFSFYWYIQTSHGRRTLERNRKKHRVKKKLFHSSSKYSVESLTLNSLKKRWSDRCARYEDMHLIELEERKKEESEEKLHLVRFQQQRAERLIQRNHEVDVNEQKYSSICSASTISVGGTSTGYCGYSCCRAKKCVHMQF